MLCGAVVVGLSVTLAKQQMLGGIPTQTNFSTFAGAFGIISSFFGLAPLLLDAIPALAVVAVDALASVFYLAAGVVRNLDFLPEWYPSIT